MAKSAEPRSEHELRAELARRLRLEAFPQGIWEQLTDLGYVRTALDPNEPEGLEDCLDMAGRFLAVAQLPEQLQVKQKVSSTGRSRKTLPWLNEAERARARAFSVYLASEARAREDVRGFRTRLMKDGLLDREQAMRLLSNPAFYYLPRRHLEAADTRLPRTRGWALSRPKENGRSVELHISLEVGEGEDRRIVRFPPVEISLYGKRLALPVPNQDHEYVVATGSYAHWARSVAIRLARSFPWTVREALWFLLTGNTPMVAPIDAEFLGMRGGAFRHGTLILYVEPWISSESVERIYRALQRFIFQNRKRQPIEKKSADLVRFIAPLEGLTWSERMRRWNRRQTRDSDRYAEPSNFALQYRRTGKSIAFPPYRPFFSSSWQRDRAKWKDE